MIFTRACQGCVVTTDIPTLGTSLKPITSKSATQEAKDLADLRDPGWTIHGVWADGPRRGGGRSTSPARTVQKTAPNLQYAQVKNGRSGRAPQTVRAARTIRPPQADGPTNSFQPKPTDTTDRNEAMQELMKNTMNSGLVNTSRMVHTEIADCPPGSHTAA
jgi:hypothetical protein